MSLRLITFRGPFKRCGICSLTKSILSEAKSSYSSFFERNYFPFKMNFFIIIISKAISPYLITFHHIIKYRMSTQVSIVVDKTYLHRRCQVLCNTKEYTIPLPTQKNNFLEIVTQLTIDKRYELLVQVIAKEKKELSLRQFYQVKDDCDRYFNVGISIDFDQLALQLLNETNLLQDLDILPFKDIMTLFKKSYDNLSLKIHGKINRRLAKYLKTSKRSNQQKENLQSLLNHIKGQSSQDELPPEKQEKIAQQDEKSKKEKKQRKKTDDNAVEKADHGNHGRQAYDNEHKEHNQPRKERPRRQRKEKNPIDIPVQKEEDNEDDWIQVPSDKERPTNRQKKYAHKSERLQDHNEQKKQQLPRKYTQKKNTGNQKSRNDNSNRRNSQSKERNYIKKDMRILLGINGATDEQWRERIRPPKIPKQNIPLPSNRQNKEKNRDNNESIKSKEIIAEPQKKIIKIEQQGQPIGRVFTYPDDGQQYRFKKDKTYSLFVNKSFWIKNDIASSTVTIQKDGAGFIRPGILQFNDDNDGLHGPGFSIQFSGTVHLQDGGKMFGETELAKFLPDGKKTFKLKSLQVFAK